MVNNVCSGRTDIGGHWGMQTQLDPSREEERSETRRAIWLFASGYGLALSTALGCLAYIVL